MLPLTVTLAACAVLVALPWFTSFATQRLIVEGFTVFAIAMAWNLLAGYGGLVVVGHQMFVGVGAYALFASRTGLDSIPGSAPDRGDGLRALFADQFRSHVPPERRALRRRHLGFGGDAAHLTLNSEWLGAGGGMPLDALSGFDRWTRNAGVYWAALAVGVGALAIARTILRGRLGLALMSVRDAEAAASASGVSMRRPS